jgi:uncharacterized membrane protein
MRYLTGGAEPPPPIVANAYANPFLAAHVAGGVVALLLGPLQFVRRIRSRMPALHRAIGLTYVAACAVAAPAGFMLALGTVAGPVAGAGFAALALLSAAFTFLGLRAAIGRRFEEHREWMLRSFALVAAAITLRLMLPAAGLLGLDFLPAYRAIAWLSWLSNLALCEYYIRRRRLSAGPLTVRSRPRPKRSAPIPSETASSADSVPLVQPGQSKAAVAAAHRVASAGSHAP